MMLEEDLGLGSDTDDTHEVVAAAREVVSSHGGSGAGAAQHFALGDSSDEDSHAPAGATHRIRGPTLEESFEADEGAVAQATAQAAPPVANGSPLPVCRGRDESAASRSATKDAEAFLTEVYQKHNPSKLAEIPSLLTKYSGQEQKLCEAVRKKYLPPPRAGGKGQQLDLPALIRKLYEDHNPEKLAELPNLLASWAGRERDLYLKACEKYGASPSLSVVNGRSMPAAAAPKPREEWQLRAEEAEENVARLQRVLGEAESRWAAERHATQQEVARLREELASKGSAVPEENASDSRARVAELERQLEAASHDSQGGSEQEISQMRARIEELEGQLDRAMSAEPSDDVEGADVDAFRAKIDELEGQLAASKSAKDKAVTAAEAATARIADLEATCAGSKQHLESNGPADPTFIEELRGKLTMAEQARDEAKAAAEEAAAQVTSLESRLANPTASEDERDSLRARIHELEKELEVANCRKDPEELDSTKTASVDELQAELESSRKSHFEASAAAEAAKEQLKATTDQLSALRQREEAFVAREAELTASLEELQGRLSLSDEARVKAEAATEEATSRAASAESAQASNGEDTDLRARVEELERQLESSQNALTEASAAAETVRSQTATQECQAAEREAGLSARVEDLEQRLAVAETARDEASAAAEEALKRCASLEEDAANAQPSGGTAEREPNESKAVIKELEAQVERKDRALADAMAAVESSREQCSALESKMEEMQGRLDAAEPERDQAKAAAEEAAADTATPQNASTSGQVSAGLHDEPVTPRAKSEEFERQRDSSGIAQVVAPDTEGDGAEQATTVVEDTGGSTCSVAADEVGSEACADHNAGAPMAEVSTDSGALAAALLSDDDDEDLLGGSSSGQVTAGLETVDGGDELL